MEAWLSVSQCLTSRYPHSVCREQSLQLRTFKSFGFSAQCCFFSFFFFFWFFHGGPETLVVTLTIPKLVTATSPKHYNQIWSIIFMCIYEEDMKRCFYMFFLYRFFTSSPCITKRYKQKKKTKNISPGQRGGKARREGGETGKEQREKKR